MDQGTLDFAHDLPRTRVSPGPALADQAGFEIGWDHAHHGLVPPVDTLTGECVVGLGWHAGRAVLGRRAPQQPRHVRTWLALRLEAWRAGSPSPTPLLTPASVRALETTHCPVLRLPLGGPTGQAQAATVTRINSALGFVPGNLLMLSQQAATCAGATDVATATLRARESAHTGGMVGGLDAAAWWRWASLRAMVTPMPYAEAVRLPLVLVQSLPGEAVNDAQALQLLISRWFLKPGSSAMTRMLGATLPDLSARQDYNLFVSVLLARVLESPAGTPARRLAVENAWLDPRVQRRWQHFMLSIGEEQARSLLARARRQCDAGARGPSVDAQGLRCCARKASIRR